MTTLDFTRFQALTFDRIEPLVEREHPGAPYSEIIRIVHRAMAGALQLPTSADEQAAFGDSVPDWPAFRDSSEALKALSKRVLRSSLI